MKIPCTLHRFQNSVKLQKLCESVEFEQIYTFFKGLPFLVELRGNWVDSLSAAPLWISIQSKEDEQEIAARL